MGYGIQDISHYCPSLMYGELSLETLAHALRLCEKLGLPVEGASMCDVGCGIGRCVYRAALLRRWSKCHVCGACALLFARSVSGSLTCATDGGYAGRRDLRSAMQVSHGGANTVSDGVASCTCRGAGRITFASCAYRPGLSCAWSLRWRKHMDLSDGEGRWARAREVAGGTEVGFTEGDVLELDSLEGFHVLLFVSAAFTDALLAQMAEAVDGLPPGVLVGHGQAGGGRCHPCLRA